MIVTASAWSEPADIYADLCIVGAGAAGLDLARFFNGSTSSVVVVEGGGLEFDAQTQQLHQVLCVGKDIQSRVFGLNSHLPPPYHFESRLRQFGGTTNIWSGRWKAHSPDDFEGKSWIPYSGWPLNYYELLPYYREISQDYRIPAEVSGWAGFDRDPAESAGNSLQYTCHHYQSTPLNFNEKFRGELERSENVTVVLNANAVGILADEATDTVRYVLAKNLRGCPLRVHANIFVLAAGGLENARLLLNLRGRTGITPGNRRDLVGRFYMDHPKTFWGRLIPAYNGRLKKGPVFEHQRATVHFSLTLSENLRRKHRLPHHSTYLYPILIGASLETATGHITRLPHIVLNRAVKRLGKLLFRYFGMVSCYELLHELEQTPNPHSRVYLSEDVTDQLNEPMLVVDWQLSEFDVASFGNHLRLMQDVVNHHRLGKIFFPKEGGSVHFSTEASHHHMGTTRMAGSSAHGVVDKNCKVFGIDNLYITGSSVFPTGGNANPTLTLLALTRRLCHHLKSVIDRLSPLSAG